MKEFRYYDYRAQHSAIFFNTTLIIIGGRNQYQNSLPIQIY